MLRLKDKVAIVTGGAQGIGLATAWRFAEEGARLAIVDANEAAGTRATDELAETTEAVFLKVDVSKRDQARQMAQAVHDHFGRIDVLINNAGILRDAQLLKMDEADFDAVIAVNLKGVFNCGQAVAEFMVAQGSGRIVNASSVVGLYGNFGQSNYVASKAGLIGMTRVWARELGRKGITVNAVAPGFIDTEMTAVLPKDIIAEMKKRIPATRMGTADEVAQAVLFLASPSSGYINGHVLTIDGGMTA